VYVGSGLFRRNANVSSRLHDIRSAHIFYMFEPLFTMIGSCLFIDYVI